ncbi:MAG: Asp-tRNA(Asn)/Glu-tRNA(Gln) amidotransferase subunit GatC [Promethearchaeota archaeon]
MSNDKEFSEETIDNVLKLALLDLSEDEKEKLTTQLSDILKYFKKLDDLDTSEVEPTTHALEIKNVVRKDIPWESLSNNDALKNSSYKKDGYFKAPKILKE